MDMQPISVRPGLLGAWDKIVGPGASLSETLATLFAMAAAAALARWAALAFGPPSWPWWTWLVVLLLASDLGGGLVANALPATKRWYHRPGTLARSHLGFAAVHMHAFVLAWLAPQQMPWLAAALLYAVMLAGSVLVLIMPRAIRLGVAYTVVACGTVVIARYLPLASPLGWVPLVLLLKIVAGHIIGP